MNWKKHNIIMLPTNEKASVSFWSKKLTLFFPERTMNNTGQHLYILSDEEIKEGDWYYCISEPCIIQCDTDIIINNEDTLKVIASTNTFLELPQPSQPFIEKYITEYNKGNIITDVIVEYDMEYFKGEIGLDFKNVLKISKDNTITIRKIKDSWSRENLINILDKYRNDSKCKYCDDTGLSDKEHQQWIEENL